MEYITTAVFTAIFTVILIFFYKYVVNPQMIIKPTLDSMDKCPDNWRFNNNMCEPQYSTHCTAFNPDDAILKTIDGKCSLARNCGTTWSGFCI